MIISPFTPLSFSDRRTDGQESEHIQTFATTDKILVQVFVGSGDTAPTGVLYTEPDHAVKYGLTWNTWEINTSTTLYFVEISLSEGYYSIAIDDKLSDVFRVTADEGVLADTTLIQYSMKDNRQRTDAVFFISNMQYFFDFRVPGGFKDSGWTFGVDSEQFVTDQSDIENLYALESTQKKFTMGTSAGVPIWFAELLNRLLCCTYVYFDGERYARKETSTPEVTANLEGVNSFVVEQEVQQVNNLDPDIELLNQTIIRRVEADSYRSSDGTNTRVV